MPSGSNDDARAARLARADAIRRARDKRNASLDTPVDADLPRPGRTTTSTDDIAPASGASDAPSYVEFIDRKMRHPKKP